MASIFKLIIEDDEGKTTVVPLRSGDISIGRMDGNTIRLMERNISRRHARLVRDNGAVFVEDLNSFNGVKINGERIDQRLEIKEGDLVEIGDYHLALQRAEVEEDIVPDDRSPTTTHGHSMAGTVPDLRLPEEIIAEAQAAQRALGDRHTLPADQDKTTRNDASLAFAAPQPIVSPPPTHERKSSPVLPPFPAAGAGVPDNPFFNPAASPSIAEGHVARTEQIKVGPSRVADVPRIVCVSTEYAGREFALNRPEIIIGRVEDNDIVIEHRSVSRNHAKILFDGRVHKIIDLESANGILVNGEEYAITDLRKGDLIELGHVRFRFVPPGIAFAPNDEEAKAMLEAGVTPPPGAPAERVEAPERAPFGPIGDDEPTSAATAESALPAPEIPNLDVPHDASNAATVTDTPLSALNLGEVFEPRVHVESPTERPAQSRSATARAPLRDEDDKRATAVGPPPTRPVARTERASAAVAPSFDDDDDVRPEGQGRGKLIAAVVVVCLLLVVVGLAFTRLTGGGGSVGTAGAPPSGAHDAELEKLYQKGDYEAVRDYYRSHLQEFADPVKALERYDQAGRAAAGPGAAAGTPPTPVAAAAAVPTPPPSEAEPAPSAAELDPGADEVAEAEPGVDEASEAEDRRGTRRRRSVRRRRPAPAPAAAPAPAPDFEKAKRYELLGRRALLGGDLVNAEASLKVCLKTAPYPPCHRQLGILYAKRDDPRRALDHYRKYVELDPSARDADEVRKFIASQGGP